MISNKAFSIAAAILLTIGALISLHQLAYYQKIFPHLKVDSINVSNITIDEASSRLQAAIPATQGGLPTVNLTFGGQDWPLDLNELGLVYQPRQTAESAYLIGRSEPFWINFATRWRLWHEGQNLGLSLTLNETALVNKVELASILVEELPIKPRLNLTTDSRVELVPGKNGRVIDKNQLYQQIYQRLGQLNFDPIEIPVTIVDTNISDTDLAAAQVRAESLKAKQLQLKAGDFSQNVAGQNLIDLYSFDPDNAIASAAAAWATQVNRPAQNAAFRFDGNRVVEFKPSLPGLKLNEQQAVQLIKEGLDYLIATTSASHTITLAIDTSEPEITTNQVNDLGIKELLGKGESTFYHSIPGRVHNVALTAQRLNGVLVKPGEVFSFNQAVGDISAATGYQSAYIIKNGRTILGDGGGVCQDSTTVFRAALNAGLEIIERHPHSYRVTYYEQNSPPGIDATVFSPSVDLKFKNNTPGHLLIQAFVDTSAYYLRVEIYGTSDGRVTTINNHRLWDQSPPPPELFQDDPTLPVGTVKQVDWAAWGAKAAFDWQVARNGEVLYQKTFYTNYQPWQAVYLRGTAGV